MNVSDKVSKLLALAGDPAATAGEAETARRLAGEICSKYGIRPAEVQASRGGATRALTGNVSPSWRPPPSPQGRWQQPKGIFRGVPETNLSGISTEEARRMALEILDAAQNGQWYLRSGEEDLIRQAFDGLLTDVGKVLLLGLHTVVLE